MYSLLCMQLMQYFQVALQRIYLNVGVSLVQMWQTGANCESKKNPKHIWYSKEGNRLQNELKKKKFSRRCYSYVIRSHTCESNTVNNLCVFCMISTSASGKIIIVYSRSRSHWKNECGKTLSGIGHWWQDVRFEKFTISTAA